RSSLASHSIDAYIAWASTSGCPGASPATVTVLVSTGGGSLGPSGRQAASASETSSARGRISSLGAFVVGRIETGIFGLRCTKHQTRIRAIGFARQARRPRERRPLTATLLTLAPPPNIQGVKRPKLC